MREFVVLVLIASGLLLVTPAAASATPSLLKLSKTVATLQKQIAAVRVSNVKAVNKLQTQITALQASYAKLKAAYTRETEILGGVRSELSAAQPVLALAPYVSLDPNAENGVKGPNIVFKGANVHVMSSYSEYDGNGLGNLIVGWDDVPSPMPPSGYDRDGSNNLVTGDQNYFVYSGGFVAGFRNITAGPFASVSGGSANAAGGSCGSVSGGFGNTAGTSGSADATVGGGRQCDMPNSYGWAAGGPGMVQQFYTYPSP